MKKTVVELIGSAGVGKTFIGEQLRRSLCVDTFRAELCLADVAWSFLSWVKILSVLPTLERDRYKIARMMLRKTMSWRAASRINQGTFLFDEGPWHFLAGSIAPRLKKEESFVFHTWSHYMELPDLVVHLTADCDLLRHRRVQRNRVNEKTIDIDKVTEAHLRFDQAVDCLRVRFPHVDVLQIKIDNSTRPEDVVETICAHLDAYAETNKDTLL